MNNRLNRNINFDLNRNPISDEESESEREIMENQQELAVLIRSIQQHQLEIQQLREQLEQQRNQQQEQNLHPRNNNLFQLTPDQVLTHFRHLKPFNGKDDYNLMEFIKSVEKAAELCNNEDFRQYSLQIVLHEKILGEAKRCVQRLGDRLTWETAKAELKLHFRPRKDYAELINECRNVKVGNLRELFEVVKSVNYQLNELYNFEEQEDRPTIYSPENNDRHLVGIVMEKLDSLVRGNVHKDLTLVEIYNRFSELKLLDDERAINFVHRKFRNMSRSDNREINRQMNRQTNKPINNNEMHLSRQYNRHNSNSNPNINNNYSSNNNVNINRNHNGNYNNNPSYRNNSNSYHGPNNNHNSARGNINNSGRFNTFNASRSPNNHNNFNTNNGSNNNGAEPMEVENVQQNFPFGPRDRNYP